MRVNYEVNTTPYFRLLSDGQIEEIFFSALEVLRETGVRVYSEEALELLRAVGYAFRNRHPPQVVRLLRDAVGQVISAGRPPGQVGPEADRPRRAGSLQEDRPGSKPHLLRHRLRLPLHPRSLRQQAEALYLPRQLQRGQDRRFSA